MAPLLRRRRKSRGALPMPLLREGWDPEAPGSRFTTRPAFALLAGEVDERLPIQEAVDQFLGEDVAQLSEPGEHRVIVGGLGRGAEGVVPVVEWIAAGVVGGAAFEGTRYVARKMRELIDHLRRAEKRVSISRGMAAMLAVDAVAERLGQDGDFVVEAVEEPATLRREPTHETNYVSIEPWVCLVVDRRRGRRAVVVVSHEGEVIGMVLQELTAGERLYTYPLPFDDDE